MKKVIVKTIIYTALIVIVILCFMIANTVLERENILERITQWPDLQINSLEGETVSTAEIAVDKPTLLYYYHTECIFCQGTFSDLKNHPNLIEEANMIFISDEEPTTINGFLTEMKVTQMPGLLFYQDHDRKVKDFYSIRAVPAIYLYDRDGKLIQFYRGAVGLEEIGSELQISVSSN